MTLASVFEHIALEQSRVFQGGSMRLRILVAVVTVAFIAAACANAGSNGKSASTIPTGGTTPGSVSAADLNKNVHISAPGVTDTEIHVAAVLTKTSNPTGG